MIEMHGHSPLFFGPSYYNEVSNYTLPNGKSSLESSRAYLHVVHASRLGLLAIGSSSRK